MYFKDKEFVTIFRALSFLDYMSFRSILFSCIADAEQQICTSAPNQFGEIKLYYIMILKLHGNETRNSCNWIAFSLGTLSY